VRQGKGSHAGCLIKQVTAVSNWSPEDSGGQCRTCKLISFLLRGRKLGCLMASPHLYGLRINSGASPLLPFQPSLCLSEQKRYFSGHRLYGQGSSMSSTVGSNNV
jgi:hypothetical protein